jgi:hypothetical protein
LHGSRRIRRTVGWFLVIAMVATVTVVAVPRARAIAFGAVDTTDNFVGAWIIQLPDASTFWCSGDLVSPRVFLSAGHCGAFALSIGVSTDHMWVTFDTNIFPSGPYPACSLPCTVPGFNPPAPDWFAVSSVVVNPLLSPVLCGPLGRGECPQNDTHDQAVVVLQHSVTGITPVALPPVGLLDTLIPGGVLRTTTITKVGYGLDENFLVTAERRMTISSEFQELLPSYLVTSGGTAHAESFTLAGDSGGPALITVNNVVYLVGTDSIIVGTLQSNVMYSERVDAASALNFIGGEIAANP